MIATRQTVSTTQTRPEPPRRPLWPHQQAALDFAENKPAVMLAVCMGGGKSRVALELLQRRGVQRALLLCPRSVVDVWPKQAAEYSDYTTVALREGTVAKRQKQAAESRANITIINYDACWREPFKSWALVQPWDALVCDESHRCHPAGTMVSTPQGDMPIEGLCVGDVIYGVDHGTGQRVETVVQHTFKRMTNTPIIRVNNTRLTVEHPVWTQERGYVPAHTLSSLDTVCYTGTRIHQGVISGYVKLRRLRERISSETAQQQSWATQAVLRDHLCWECSMQTDFYLCMVQDYISGKEIAWQERTASAILRKVLFGKMANVTPGVCGDSKHPQAQRDIPREYAAIAGTARCSSEVSSAFALGIQPAPRSQNTDQGSNRIAADGLLNAQRRQRKGINSSTAPFGRAAGMGNGIYCQDQSGAGRTADSLQGGYSRANAEDRYRSGRSDTYVQVSEGSRWQEGCLLAFTRLDGAPILEQGNTQRNEYGYQQGASSCEVFNLETDTGNYFADGLLVHNCKAPGGVMSRFVATLARRVPLRVGLTGTPMPHSPLDVYGQYRILDPEIFGTSYRRFMYEYAITKPMQGFEMIVGYKNQARLHE